MLFEDEMARRAAHTGPHWPTDALWSSEEIRAAWISLEQNGLLQSWTFGEEADSNLISRHREDDDDDAREDAVVEFLQSVAAVTSTASKVSKRN